MTFDAEFRRRGRWALVLGAGLATALAVAAAYRLTSDASGDPIHEAVSQGEAMPAPPLDLLLLSAGDLGAAPRRWWRVARDGRLSLSELRGRAVVLNFWSARCKPCRDEAPVLEQVAREAGHDVLVLGVSINDSAEAARRFVHEQGLSFPQARDSTMETARHWGVSNVPETFFISPDGHVLGHVVGTATARQLERGIALATVGRPSGLHTGGRQHALE